NLPGTAASDDLAVATGTLGTHQPYITAGDLKAAGSTTRYARAIVPLPSNYETAETVVIRVYAGMQTTIADSSCNVDVEARMVAKDGTVSADLVTTAATSMNSLSAAAYDFAITSSGLEAGDMLDIRIAVVCNDAATGTAVISNIYQVELLSD